MANLKDNVGAKYLAYLLGIISAWAVSELTHTPHFDALTAEPALVALAVLVLGWLAACSTHYLTTGSVEPVPPAAAAVTRHEQRLHVPAAPPMPPAAHVPPQVLAAMHDEPAAT